MPTGACGINCDVCKLNLLGTCSSCGSGKSLEAEQKLAAQNRLFGSTCAILSCARMNQIEHRMIEGDLAEALESRDSLHRQLQLKLHEA